MEIIGGGRYTTFAFYRLTIINLVWFFEKKIHEMLIVFLHNLTTNRFPDSKIIKYIVSMLIYTRPRQAIMFIVQPNGHVDFTQQILVEVDFLDRIDALAVYRFGINMDEPPNPENVQRSALQQASSSSGDNRPH